MADGYGFGGEGDWKTAALVRIMKVMAHGLQRRDLLHGGLHLSSSAGNAEGARLAHAGDLPIDRRRQAVARSASAGHRRQSRSGAARFHRAAGTGLNASHRSIWAIASA